MATNTPLTASKEKTASNKKGDKLRERIGIALKKSRVADNQVQRALEYPGTGLEDGMVDVIIRFSNMVCGIVTPLSAIETGLIPKGWTVESDDLEGGIDLIMLDFSYAPCKKDEDDISGEELIKRSAAAKALGSFGLCKIILDEQEAGRKIDRQDLHDEYIVFPRTILRNEDGQRMFAALCYDWSDEEYKLNFFLVDDGSGYDSEIVVPRDHK